MRPIEVKVSAALEDTREDANAIRLLAAGSCDFDVPVRRGSRSAWMSDSASSSPGGQPSTTAPIAGPWLSPKVVTQNERPIVLPDIALALQPGGAEQEHL